MNKVAEYMIKEGMDPEETLTGMKAAMFDFIQTRPEEDWVPAVWLFGKIIRDLEKDMEELADD